MEWRHAFLGNTVFVEVALSEFFRVKTVNDLLKPALRLVSIKHLLFELTYLSQNKNILLWTFLYRIVFTIKIILPTAYCLLPTA